MFKSIKRARWRTRVLTEFHKLYGLHLGRIGDEIGSDKLDELLNSVCDRPQARLAGNIRGLHRQLDCAITAADVHSHPGD